MSNLTPKLSNPILLRHINLELLNRHRDIRLSQRAVLRRPMRPRMLNLDIPLGVCLRIEFRAHMLVVAGLVAILFVGSLAHGIEAGGVGGLDAEDVELVGTAAGGAAGVEIGNMPG